MGHEPWISDETRMDPVARRVFARALHRPVQVIVIALLAAGAYLARGLAGPTYQATLYFRLAEGDLTDRTNSPRPPRAIREYISNVALSRDRVEQIMKKYNFSSGYLARNRVAAIDEFKEDVNIDVSRNYFLYDRSPGEAPRSALVTISLSGSDAGETREVLHEIGDAILKEQGEYRGGRLAQARELLGAQLNLARARVKSLQETLDRLWADLPGADAREAIEIRARMAALPAEITGAIERVYALERRSAEVAFSTAAESQQLGLNFELFDESLVASGPRLTPFQLVGRAALVLVIAFLLAMPLVGAFDDRIYGPQDLAARGLPFLGALPQFPGDDAGSYRARFGVKHV